MMNEDWRYSDERMEIRQDAYMLLLSQFGSKINSDGKPIHSMQNITECAHDWVSQGNVGTNGLVKYYQTYYIS